MGMARTVLALMLLCAAPPALAASVSVAVVDADGKPALGAVVELVPDAGQQLPASQIPAEAIIDQRHETFIPLVSIIRRGGHVVFTNNDTTKHQVYSFSTVKQFALEVDQGQRSAPLVFDKSGVASIGCNIHDQMITYVYVATSPFAAMTDEKGLVRFPDVPPGPYHANVWHSQLVPGKPAPSQAIVVSRSGAAFKIAAPLMAVSASGMTHMHMGEY